MPASEINWMAIAPFLSLSVLGFIILTIGIVAPKLYRETQGAILLVGFAIAFVFTLFGWGESQSAFSGLIVMDKFAVAFNCMFIIGAILTLLLSINAVEGSYLLYSDYFSLLVFATAGMTLMASGTHLLTIFLGLETLSIALYVLAGFRRTNIFSLESAFKYFLLGAFASGFLLYGIALVFGAVGSANLDAIGAYISENGIGESKMLITGLLLLFVGFGFKISVFPFHLWTPDVYQGAPTPISAFMATGSKAAGFAALLRLFVSSSIINETGWQEMIWIISVVTMLLGNIIAIKQSNVKRMLAYSSIAHAGYVLIGVLAGNHLGSSGVVFYLLIYTFMNIGAFGVVSYISSAKHEFVTFSDFRGLAFQRPFAAIAMAVFMFSLAGIPPTAGFMAKFYVFSAAVKAGYVWLVIFAVISSMISLYYYLNLLVQMFMAPKSSEAPAMAKQQPAVALALTLSLFAVIFIGLFPARWIDLFKEMAGSLM